MTSFANLLIRVYQSAYAAQSCIFFFFNDTATTEIYTLSLHDALPIHWRRSCCQCRCSNWSWWCSRDYRRQHQDRKSTRLNSSHVEISYAVFCLKKKKKNKSLMVRETKNDTQYKY